MASYFFLHPCLVLFDYLGCDWNPVNLSSAMQFGSVLINNSYGFRLLLQRKVKSPAVLLENGPLVTVAKQNRQGRYLIVTLEWQTIVYISNMLQRY